MGPPIPPGPLGHSLGPKDARVTLGAYLDYVIALSWEVTCGLHTVTPVKTNVVSVPSKPPHIGVISSYRANKLVNISDSFRKPTWGYVC
jgi:hypothetical protein